MVLIILVLTSILISSPKVGSASSSDLLRVPYFEQENDYYCGPASVQMAIAYLSGSAPAQDQIAGELQTNHEQGITERKHLKTPFNLRNYNDIYVVEPMSVNELKRQNAEGNLAIILIWFEIPHTDYKHYVVTVGHNETGVFIHDPWPRSWPQPGRDTGPNVYLSDSELEYLWDCEPYHWAQIIPKEPAATLSLIDYSMLLFTRQVIPFIVLIGTATLVTIVVVRNRR